MKSALVVDDSRVDREKLSDILEEAGYAVCVAENGRLALESVKHIKPELILMDINMPEMDGFATTRELRDNPETDHIPIVLVSSKCQKADKAWGRMLGAKAYVTKPYEGKDVLAAINEI